MKKLTTILCCMMFMVAGVALAIDHNENILTSATIRGATLYNIPSLDISKVNMPLDLLLDQAKKADTLNTAIQDEPEVTKADNHKVKAPMVIERTVEVPVLYIATPADNKGDPPEDAPLYSVHKLDDGAIGMTIPSSLGVEPYEE